jgi:predicted heme/steroid binding protein
MKRGVERTPACSMRHFTLHSLKQCDGRDGAPSYIAFRGNVYDVSENFLWQGGRHQALHSAGRDLTGDLETAPHGEEMLSKCPIVGILD